MHFVADAIGAVTSAGDLIGSVRAGDLRAAATSVRKNDIKLTKQPKNLLKAKKHCHRMRYRLCLFLYLKRNQPVLFLVVKLCPFYK